MTHSLEPRSPDIGRTMESRTESKTMPLTYSVDHRSMRVRATGHASVTLPDIADYIAARVRDGIDDYPQVIDLQDAQFDISPPALREMVRQLRAKLRRKVVPTTAFVAIDGSRTAGIAQELAALIELDGEKMQVFSSVDDANRWLDNTTDGR